MALTLEDLQDRPPLKGVLKILFEKCWEFQDLEGIFEDSFEK